MLYLARLYRYSNEAHLALCIAPFHTCPVLVRLVRFVSDELEVLEPVLLFVYYGREKSIHSSSFTPILRT